MEKSSDQRTEDCLAYQWWNSQISCIKNLNQQPEVVLPSEAHEIWSKICPIFLLFVIDEQDVRTYWESIQTIVNMFVSDQISVPNPISHFPEFIQILYNYQNILNPKTVDYTIYFIKKFGFHDAAHFFLYQSPVFILDPILYFETLIELRSIQYFLWNDFVKKSVLVDGFFEMYSSFLIPLSNEFSHETIRHRILICEVFFAMIEDSFNNHPNILPIINKFLDASVNLASSTTSDQLFPVYRTIFSLFDFIELNGIIQKADLASRSISLFESSTNYLTFKYLYSKQYITSTQVLNVISKRGISSIEDIKILMEIADQSTPAHLFIFLVRSAIKNHLWHRACFSLIKTCITRLWSNRQDVRDLVFVVVRRLVIWVSLSSVKRKYGVRALLICESLSSLAETRVMWLQQAVLSAAVSIVSSSKPVPVYFRSFFPQTSGIQIDDVVVHEWDTFEKSAKLKTFPFDAVSGMLIMPPTREQRALRGQIQIANVSGGFAMQQSSSRSLNSAVSGTFSTTKKINVRQVEPKKNAASSLAIRVPLNVNDSQSKTKQKSAIASSSSFAVAKNHQQLAKKQSQPVQVVIKRPESSCRTSRSQTEIRFHAKRKDAFLP